MGAGSCRRAELFETQTKKVFDRTLTFSKTKYFDFLLSKKLEEEEEK